MTAVDFVSMSIAHVNRARGDEEFTLVVLSIKVVRDDISSGAGAHRAGPGSGDLRRRSPVISSTREMRGTTNVVQLQRNNDVARGLVLARSCADGSLRVGPIEVRTTVLARKSFFLSHEVQHGRCSFRAK